MALKVDNEGLTGKTSRGQTEKILFADVIKICLKDEPNKKKTGSANKTVSYYNTTESPKMEKCPIDSTDDTTIMTEALNGASKDPRPIMDSATSSERMATSAIEDLSLVDGDRHTVVLWYVKHGTNRHMSVSENSFTMRPQESQELLQTLNKCLKNVQRPRQLLVLLNPFSGGGNALKIFSSVKYLFELAGISCDTTVLSETSDLATVIQNKDLTQFDGVIVVGGDGSLSSTVTCLMKKTQKDVNIDVSDSSTDLKQCLLPIGIIPAGTGNMMVKMLHGNDDVITATLHIIRGLQQPTNIYSIYQGGELSLYSVLLMGFGFSGELIKSSLRKKWMGSAKYFFSLLDCLLTRRHSLKLKLSYRLAQDTDTSCGNDVDTNINASKANGEDAKWKTIEEDIQGLDSFLVSLVESGPSLKYSFGDSSGQLFIIKKCSLSEHMKFYSCLGSNKPSVFCLNYVDCVQITSCRIELLDPNLTSSRSVYLNCDGELIPITTDVIDIRFHYHGLRLFTAPT